jgi:hypothetical protein
MDLEAPAINEECPHDAVSVYFDRYTDTLDMRCLDCGMPIFIEEFRDKLFTFVHIKEIFKCSIPTK